MYSLKVFSHKRTVITKFFCRSWATGPAALREIINRYNHLVFSSNPAIA